MRFEDYYDFDGDWNGDWEDAFYAAGMEDREDEEEIHVEDYCDAEEPVRDSYGESVDEGDPDYNSDTEAEVPRAKDLTDEVLDILEDLQNGVYVSPEEIAELREAGFTEEEIRMEEVSQPVLSALGEMLNDYMNGIFMLNPEKEKFYQETYRLIAENRDQLFEGNEIEITTGRFLVSVGFIRIGGCNGICVKNPPMLCSLLLRSDDFSIETYEDGRVELDLNFRELKIRIADFEEED
jgi:hypothetical protein